MEKQVKFYLSIPGVALATLLLLMVPLVAMQFNDEVNWSAFDFMLMGALIFGTGVLFVLAMRVAQQIAYRVAMGLAIGATFLMIWANLAVGLIGSGPNLGNLLYIGVLAVLIIGIYLSRFKSPGLERAMFATALALIAVAIIALLANLHKNSASSITEIIGVNLFFATPYLVAGLLLRYMALQRQQPGASADNK
jgi:hypothetical protein